MRAAIYNPYLDTLGGGERYTLSVAKVLLDKGYDVDIEWKSETIIKDLENRFGIKLNGIKVTSDIKRGDGYDLCFWVSDGSVPALKARRNFLHFQVPFQDVNGSSLINRMKLYRIEKVICNSEFTKNIIDKEYKVDSLVIYPPVDTKVFKSQRKENMILCVGRFSGLLQSKRQDVLIQVFKKIYDQGYKNWHLILAGGSEVGDNSTGNLIESAESYPVKIIKSPSLKILKDLYGKSRIFWSASGFEEDENLHPEKLEHFGITVVEAMSAGSVPVVFKAGGFKEIITEAESGFLWEDKSELLSKTVHLINNKGLISEISGNAIRRSKDFSYEAFKSNFQSLF